VIRLYAVYQRPKDYPDGYAVREWSIVGTEISPSKECQFAPTLDGARRLIPGGLTRLPRFDKDDPVLVEVWL
jgi:hypothetical protein